MAALAAVCLVLVTVAVHVAGLYVVTLRLFEIRARDISNRGRRYLLRLVVLVTLYVVTLHMIEVAIWATFYRAAVGFHDWPAAMNFSLGSYSTSGADEVVLPREWKLLEGVEAMLGALMFGLSTAFLFAVITEVHRLSLRRAA